MIFTTNMMLEKLNDYANPKSKLSRMVKQNECFQITKGLYETKEDTPGYLLAGSIYGPSYISFDFALSYYGLIPEAVYTVTCATYDKKKKKKYENTFGTFTYRDVPKEAFPVGIKLIQDGDYYYRIAEPEKALCDKLYTLNPVSNTRQLETLLLDYLRIDLDSLKNLDKEKISSLSKVYHSKNVIKLDVYMRRLK